MIGSGRHRRASTGDVDPRGRLRSEASRLLGATGGPPAAPPSEETHPSAFGVLAASSGTSLLTTKQMLIAFSHAIEAECGDRLEGAHAFGVFQRAEFLGPSSRAWSVIASSAASAWVFADFGVHEGPRRGSPIEIALGVDSPFLREWVVVVDGPRTSVALAARERPGQAPVRDDRRLFDSAWTTDPAVVRRVALLLARTADEAGGHGAAAVVAALGLPLVRAAVDTALRERLLDRLLVSIDDGPDPVE